MTAYPHMIVRIHRARLVEARACQDGLAIYDAIAGLAEARGDKRARKRLRITWTPLHSVWLAVAHPNHALWLEQQGMIPPIRGANLGGANLYGANLGGADLGGANLGGANLRGAYRPTDPPAGWVSDAYGYLRGAS